jgi:hypothetical protein
LTPHKRKRHQEEGLCLKCHKNGHRLFQCPELTGKTQSTLPTNTSDGGMAALRT